MEDIVPDDPISQFTRTIATIQTGPSRAGMSELDQRLEWLVMRWAWFSRFQQWTTAMRSLACAIRVLEDAGLVVRERKVRGRIRVVSLTRTGVQVLRFFG